MTAAERLRLILQTPENQSTHSDSHPSNVLTAPSSDSASTESSDPQQSTLQSALAMSRRHNQAQASPATVPKQFGEVASDLAFVPFNTFLQYPRICVEDSRLAAQVADLFFRQSHIWQRAWDLYYIRVPKDPNGPPLMLITASDATEYLMLVNAAFNTNLRLPQSAVQLRFHDDELPRPRFAARCSSQSQLRRVEDQIANTQSSTDIAKLPTTYPADLRAFKAMIDAAVKLSKPPSGSDKKQDARINRKKDASRQLRRTQRYLGFRSALAAEPNDPLLRQMAEMSLEKLAVEYMGPTHVFESDVLFISIDVESYERAQSKITEIGVSCLDSRDLCNTPPGSGGIHWMNKVRGQHFRIREFAHLINHEFIRGCPDRFERQFGQSEYISIQEVPQVMASIFRAPDFKNAETGSQAVPSDSPRRNVVLVGHAVGNDITYLRKAGFDLTQVSNIIEVVDTLELYRALTHDSQGPGLGSVLAELGIAGWNLHNAGNDAAYTMQAMIGIAVRSLEPSVERHRDDLQNRLDEAKREATTRVQSEEAEWEVASADAADGGEPIGVQERAEAMATGAMSDAGGSTGRQAKVPTNPMPSRNPRTAQDKSPRTAMANPTRTAPPSGTVPQSPVSRGNGGRARRGGRGRGRGGNDRAANGSGQRGGNHSTRDL